MIDRVRIIYNCKWQRMSLSLQMIYGPLPVVSILVNLIEMCIGYDRAIRRLDMFCVFVCVRGEKWHGI